MFVFFDAGSSIFCQLEEVVTLQDCSSAPCTCPTSAWQSWILSPRLQGDPPETKNIYIYIDEDFSLSGSLPKHTHFCSREFYFCSLIAKSPRHLTNIYAKLHKGLVCSATNCSHLGSEGEQLVIMLPIALGQEQTTCHFLNFSFYK